jgi:anaerobic ribonucleoside-triphosphate reductase
MPKVNIQCGNSVFPTIPNLGLTPPITINIEEEEIEQIKKFGFKVDYLVEIEPEKPISTINITLKDDSIEIIDTPEGELGWRCPNCGNTDQTKMNVARRTCGYIGTNFWNKGRTEEIKERVMHIDNKDA